MISPVALFEAARAALDATGLGLSHADLAAFLARHEPRLVALCGVALSDAPFAPELTRERIVTLNLGLGRDSLAMMGLLVERRLRAEGRLVQPEEVAAVVFSDTGAEWDHTLGVIPRVRRFCLKHGLRFLHLRKPPAEGPEGWRDHLAALPPPGSPGRRAALAARPWRSLAPDAIEARARQGWYHLRPPIMADYQSRATIASRAKKDCTHNNKVEPIRKVTEDLALERFGLDHRAWGREVRAGRRRPHLALIGIAADEAERAVFSHPRLGGDGPWYASEAYPLLELGIAKKDEQPILDRHGFGDARKSGCFMCPFQPLAWYWALRETDPEAWSAVVLYEAAALERNPRMFLLGDTPIADQVDAWSERNPDADPDEVLSGDYKRSCARFEAAA